MRVFGLVALLLATASASATANTAAGARTLSFTEHGFSIEPPAGHDASQVQQIVTLSLPQSAGFTPNVNVQVQPFAGSMDEYIAISLEQFKANGVKLVSQKHDARSATMEYTGAMQGHPLHWYARAYRTTKSIILATATADESQWASSGPALRKSVDSLRLLP